jgi:hypothetical protein
VAHRYKLYIDGKQADGQSVSVWTSFFGGVTFVVSCHPQRPKAVPRTVKAVVSFRLIRKNEYAIYVNGEQIHHERATFGGV